jgi:hypothetical protein
MQSSQSTFPVRTRLGPASNGLGWAVVFAAVLGLPILAGAAERTALERPGLQEFFSSLQGKPEDGNHFRLIGPQAEKCVRFEPAGLRITLPQGHPGFRSATGVLTYLTVRGDFEITVRFEILTEPEKQDVGPFGTRLSLQAGMEIPDQDQVKFARAVQRARKTQSGVRDPGENRAAADSPRGGPSLLFGGGGRRRRFLPPSRVSVQRQGSE